MHVVYHIQWHEKTAIVHGFRVTHRLDIREYLIIPVDAGPLTLYNYPHELSYLSVISVWS